eukprot:jgi/Phyca11/117960/e_gw1.34.405.1
MLAVGAKRSKIYAYLLEHDENVIQSDVDNLVRRHASSVSSADDNDATAREIVVFAAADPEMSSGHMRRMYSRFSEILLVDCSHKTNQYVLLRDPGLYVY